MLTSSREEPDLHRSYELGCNAYVVKPVDFWKFTIRIANAHGLLSWALGFDAGGAAQAAAQVGACPARTRWR